MKIVLLVVVLLVLLCLSFGYIMFYIIAVRSKKKPQPGQSKWLEPYREEIKYGITWFKDQSPEKVQIRSKDGLLLTGYFLPTEDAIGTVLLVHGYRSDPYSDFGVALPFYHSLKLNILVVYQRSHGESEGKYITFGIKERFDVQSWAYYIYDRLGKNHSIIIGGISMGSSTVLMSLGCKLPTSVRFIVADCGYTSPDEELSYIIRKKYHLPPVPVLFLVNYFSRIFADFSFQDYSTKTALSSNLIPILFAHGERDGLVPFQFSQENFHICISEKSFIKSKDAGHGGSYFFSRKEYQYQFCDYLQRFLK